MRIATLVAAGLVACAGLAVADESTRELENLEAFTRLYGYVRFFHPSDAAAEIDQDRFAVHGAEAVRGAADTAELKRTLRELFAPIAPTVTIYDPAQDTLPPLQLQIATEGVAWQHLGVGLSPGLYTSARTGRSRPQASDAGFGTVTQGVDAREHRGKEMRLSGRLRADVAGAGNEGRMWLRVDREKNQQGFFDNMADRPTTAAEWTPSSRCQASTAP